MSDHESLGTKAIAMSKTLADRIIAPPGLERSQPTAFEIIQKPWRPPDSALCLGFILRDPRLHQLFHKSSRQGLVHRETDGPFGCVEVLEFVLERLDHGRTHGEKTAMVRKRREPHQGSFVPERRNSIADSLRGLRRHHGPNRRANLVQGAAGGFRDSCKVFVHALRSDVEFRGRTAITRLHLFDTRHSTRPLSSGPNEPSLYHAAARRES